MRILLIFFLMTRVFHPVTVVNFDTCGLTHVKVSGIAMNPRHEKDGDWVFDFKEGDKLVHLEIIPELPLRHPKNGACVEVSGIRRFDDENAPGHNRWEVHPVIKITPCKSQP